MNKTLEIAALQHGCGPDLASNLEASCAMIEEACEQGAELIVLQELHRSTYFCQTEDVRCFDLAEPIPGPTTARLGELARARGVVIVASLFERRAPGLCHNTAVVLDVDGTIAGRYRKMHIPDDPGFYEKFYFTPGDLGFEPINTRLGRLGVLICWDQWFPEAARLMAMAGAEVLIFPTAIGWDSRDDDAERARQLDAWITVQRAHAIANGVPLVACNRTGHEPDPSESSPGIAFWGHSFVCGPQGEVLAQGGEGPQIVRASLERSRTTEVRRIWPFWRDRRVDHYGELARIYRD